MHLSETKKIHRTSVFCIAAILSSLGILTLPACSNSKFTENNTDIKTTANRANASAEGAGGFAQSGKSLDLYVIMDRSGSLFVDPGTRAPGSGSDPTCKRFDALMGLVDALRAKLKNKEQVRLTIVTFNDYTETLPSTENVLALSPSEMNSRYRRGVCVEPRGLPQTEYSLGINKTLAEHQRLNAMQKMDLKTVLFFSDGAAKDKNTQALRNAISAINSTFPHRIYSVLLGSTTDKCSLKDDQGQNLSTSQCLLEVAGGNSDRLVQVDHADGLVSALTGLVEK